jgi:hypothetical protein
MTKLGRPPKVTKSSIIVNDLLVQHISTKADNYKNEISYLKIIDEQYKIKLKALLTLKDDTLTIPLWANENQYILKVKKKHTNHLSVDFEPRKRYSIRVEFIAYEFENADKKILKGYYSTVPFIGTVREENETENIEAPEENTEK